MKLTTLAVGAALAATAAFSSLAHAEFPEKPIRLIVPYVAGGGSDTFARTLQKGLADTEALPVPVVVENVDGGGSSIGMRKVKDADPDGHTLLLHHLTTHTAPAFGVTDFDWTAYEPVAQLAIDPLVYVVMEDSDHDSLGAYLDAAAEAPGTMQEATAFGTTIHVMSMIMDGAYEAEKGALPKRTLVQSGGTSKRLPLLMGDHVAGTFLTFADLANYEAQGVKGIAIFTDERNESAPDLPTAKEQGINVALSQTFWLYAPADTPEDRIATLAAAFEQALDSPAVTEALEAKAMQKSFLVGEELDAALVDISANIAESVAKYNTQ